MSKISLLTPDLISTNSHFLTQAVDTDLFYVTLVTADDKQITADDQQVVDEVKKVELEVQEVKKKEEENKRRKKKVES